MLVYEGNQSTTERNVWRVCLCVLSIALTTACVISILAALCEGALKPGDERALVFFWGAVVPNMLIYSLCKLREAGYLYASVCLCILVIAYTVGIAGPWFNDVKKQALC